MGSIATAVFAGISIQLGVLEFLTFRGLAKADKLDAEQYTLHFVAFLCLVTGAIVFAILRDMHVEPTAAAGTDASQEQLLASHT